MKKLSMFGVMAALWWSCGGEVTKDGTPANSGANSGPGLNSTTVNQTGRMEMGSPDATVIDAYNRIFPLWCAYDATCAEPLLQDQCPFPSVSGGGDLSGQCWVVNSGELTQCESALRGAQCQGQWENFPPECYTAVRQCACLDGFVSAFDEQGRMGCFEPCNDGECGTGLGCYDGACMPPQDDRCPDGQTEDFVDGVEGCFDECFNGDEDCKTGFVCSGFSCIPDAGE